MAKQFDIDEYTVSEKFDRLRHEFEDFMRDKFEKTQEEKLEIAVKIRKELEELTNDVSAIDMFSSNENYEEMDPKNIKFLLLPYYLGSIVDTESGLNRPNVDRLSVISVLEIYYKDFLSRLLSIGIISDSPYLKKLLQKENEADNTEENEGASKKFESPTAAAVRMKEVRDYKVGRFKKSKELDTMVVQLEKQIKLGAEDEVVVKELYSALVRKYSLKAEEELEMLQTEKKMLDFMKNGDKSGAVESTSASSTTSGTNGLPYKTFILTKTAAQKEVFGRGYPSLPSMTVDELYQERIQSGLWAPPGGGGGSGRSSDGSSSGCETPRTITSAGNTPRRGVDEDSDTPTSTCEEEEEEEERGRLLVRDEYRDTHRAGWGNRHNRS